jgi:tRNA-splicing ligase RtcB
MRKENLKFNPVSLSRMEKSVKTEKLPIKLWLNELEPGASKQAKNLANLPFAFKHIAIMPDAHEGYGMPIGGVMATLDNIVPNAVGVDIGCGMTAARTHLHRIGRNQLLKLMEILRTRIPVGFKHHKGIQDEDRMPQFPEGVGDPSRDLPISWREYNSARYQIGTLGGGNHFIEIQAGSDGFIWVMVHSGSRNLGKKVADHYNKTARRLNESQNSPVPGNWQLAHLPVDHPEGRRYINEMNFCIAFAFANRQLMIERLLESIIEVAPEGFGHDEIINIAHNYASYEKHFGRNVWVHRKGATQANSGQIGIIPGSQGAESFIVEGKGNPESFKSCSHGAGRILGRKQAIRNLDLATVIASLESRNIIHSIRNQRDLDEAPQAYKDIKRVMELQHDLVKIKVKLDPLAVLKG